MKRLILSSVLVVGALLLVSCASSSYGTKMDSAQVKQIQKGVTTKDQVIAMYGAPMSSSLMPDGRRMMMYMYSETNMRLKNPGLAFVPMVGGLLVGSQGSQQRQMLQVYLKNDVVEDFEYTDGTSHIERNAFRSSVTPMAPTSPAKELPIVIPPQSPTISMVSTNN